MPNLRYAVRLRKLDPDEEIEITGHHVASYHFRNFPNRLNHVPAPHAIVPINEDQRGRHVLAESSIAGDDSIRLDEALSLKSLDPHTHGVA